jgi:iron complex transport system substrate-binding protein
MLMRLLVPFAILCCGCSGPPAPPAVEIGVRDSLGRTVAVPNQANRIVSLASSNTEILFALGLDAEIVGATEFCTYPEAAKAKTRVGGFAPQTFNVEVIAALKPDLVLAGGELHRPVIESLERIGVPVAGFQGESFRAIQENVESIGRLVGKPDAAAEIVRGMKASLAAVAKRVEGKPRPTVFYLVSDDPLMTAGKNSMITEVISLAGGDNVFADVDGDYPRINDEEILKRNPSIVLVPNYGHDGKTKTPQVLASLEAVRTKHVFVVDADPISRPAPRIVKAVEQIADLLHPKP